MLENRFIWGVTLVLFLVYFHAKNKPQKINANVVTINNNI